MAGDVLFQHVGSIDTDIDVVCDEKGKAILEHLLTTGKIEGKRSRGRQRIKIQDGIAAWLGRSTAEMFVDARDRKKWKVMIAYACNRHGN